MGRHVAQSDRGLQPAVAQNLPYPRENAQYPSEVRNLWTCIALLGSLLLTPRIAHAWWEATLQQVDIVVELAPDGSARIRYDLRYHVDRGRFEGLTIEDPGRVIAWDRPVSYVQDARGRRVGVNILRRHRDGAYLVRTARGDGFRRGWVTVHLEHTEDLRECCIRTDPEGRHLLIWYALSWEVGMDRMTIAVHLPDSAPRPQADDATGGEFSVEPLPDGLLLDRIRPVRWYRPRLGLILPQGWLGFEPPVAEEERGRPEPGSQAAAVAEAPLPVVRPESGEELPKLVLALTALAILLLLSFKWWISGKGYPGTHGPGPALVLPRVPPLLRWTVLGGAVLAGAWLQSASFLAAGTLAVAVGVLLGLRRPVTSVPEPAPATWWQSSPADMASLRDEWTRGRRRWARLFDGTSPSGALVLLAAGAGAASLVWWLRPQVQDHILDAVAIDAILTLAAVSLTGRRRDLPPTLAAGAATLLGRSARALGRVAAGSGSEAVVLAGGPTRHDEAERFRLILEPPPAGLQEVAIDVEQRRGLNGWALRLVATVTRDDGEVATIRSRFPRALARRLRRRLGS